MYAQSPITTANTKASSTCAEGLGGRAARTDHLIAGRVAGLTPEDTRHAVHNPCVHQIRHDRHHDKDYRERGVGFRLDPWIALGNHTPKDRRIQSGRFTGVGDGATTIGGSCCYTVMDAALAMLRPQVPSANRVGCD